MIRAKVDLGEFRHNAGRSSAVGDDVVNLGIRGNVVSKELYRGYHDKHSVQSGPSLLRRGRMSRHSMESEFGIVQCHRRPEASTIYTRWVPGEYNVYVAE